MTPRRHSVLPVLAGALLLLAGSPAWGYTVPDTRRDAALARAAPPDSVPIEFAVAIDIDGAELAGQWTAGADGRHWSLPLHSPGAVSLSLRLPTGALPSGTRIDWSLPDGNHRHGPYLAAGSADDAVWTPVVPGSRALLRITYPDAGEPPAPRQLTLFHGYRDTFGFSGAKDLGDSGDCNVDVACPEAGQWDDEVRSVARLQIAGTRLCSGVLVNNLRQDLTPYVLTADHCLIGPDAEDSPASSVVFYWNLQNASCGGDSRTADTSQTTSGASFVSDDVASDFTLLRLVQDPPLAYNLHHAGLDARRNAPGNGVSIHHPSGDTKKISFYTGPASRARVDIGDGRVVDSWRVSWDQGTTEPGSSGAGLWNAGRRVVGLLSGGTASCSAPSDPDFFGRLEEAWEAGAASSAQLKAHLDPDATCQLTIAGRDATAGPGASASGTACASGESESVGGSISLLSLLLLGAPALIRRRRT